MTPCRFMQGVRPLPETTDDSVALSVVKELQKLVLSGDVRPGDRLPSERAWSERLGVSRQSVREALRVLEVNGLVERRSRGGTYVGQGDLRQAFLPVLLRIRSGARFIQDIMELRRILEPAIAGLAAVRADESQLASVRAADEQLRRLDKRAMEKDPILGQDFHLAIAAASNNKALQALMTALVDVFGLWHADIVRQSDQHDLAPSRRRIIEALERRDADAAAAAMLLHLDEVAALIGAASHR